MTAVDWYPIATKILGPQRVLGSVPPHDILFLDGAISVDLVAGTFEFCTTGYVGQLSDLDAIHEELNGADPHAILAEYSRRPKWSGALLSQFKMVQT
jgi:hypothetical protein